MDLKKQDAKHLQPLHEGHNTTILYLEHSGDQPPTVVKIARSTSPMSRQAELFANELNMSQRLDQPGVRKAIETGIFEGKPALYLEYIGGVTLKKYLAAKKPNLVEMLTIGLGITENLVALHGADILYKNLNSEHIILAAGKRPVLIDFTIATHYSSTSIAEQADLLEGNLAYISPEQTGRIKGVVDYRADLYSLGVVLYEMLAGQLPFTVTSTAELIHEHIARRPEAIHDLNPKVPKGLSDIVMKLLKKSAEKRYQSAFGVARDLERCLDQHREYDRIEPFTLGQDDMSEHLLFPSGLHNRERELQLLQDAFDNALAGQNRVVIISGPAGAGKTLLVNELRHSVITGGGVFVTGNYDQYQRNVPFNGLNQAFLKLSGILTSLDPKQLKLLQAQLRHETNSWDDVLKTVLPGLQLLLMDPELPENPPSSTPLHQHLISAIRAVLFILAKDRGPLVLFLDNLQWAGHASLEVLKLLAEKRDACPLLIIGAYDGELPENEESSNAISIGQLCRDPSLQWIYLDNLSQATLQGMVESMVRRCDIETASLAEMVFNKTAGNPLLAIEFIHSLYEDRKLWFDFVFRQWQWDEQAVREKEVMDGTVSSATGKVNGLSAQTQELLMMAACIGNEFTLETLVALCEQSIAEVRDNLWQAEEEFLIIPLDYHEQQRDYENNGMSPPEPTKFAFSHARVRQAAYSLKSPRLKRLSHLRLGRIYLLQFGEEGLQEHLFSIVDQLNEGFRHMETQEERLRLAELNLIAGTRARHSGAYAAATWYLNMGLGLLPKDRWSYNYDLSRRLFGETIEAEYLSCNFSRVHLLADELALHLTNDQERAKASKYKIMAHAAEGHHDKAFATALVTLENLGVMKREEMPGNIPQVSASLSQVDTTTIIKASHMLSQEIHVEQLLEKFMQIVMENVAAEKGVMIIDQGGQMVIQGLGRVGDQAVKTMRAVPLVGSDEVPQSIISAVVNTKNAVVLGDAYHDSHFSQDEYIRKHQGRSILCLPLLHKAHLVGVVYLENNLTANVFATDQLQLLNTLLSQVGISMENAKLYASLEEKLQELGKTKDKLIDSRNWLDKIINAIPDPVFVKDREHRWVLLNNSVCEFIGRSREELLGKSDYDFFPKEEADIFWAKDEAVFTTGADNINEEKLSTVTGSVHTILTRKTLYTDDQGNQYIVAIIQDLTERVNLENQLRQAVKMEAVGNLAGGVAHDFNNMLTAIIGYCDMVLLRNQEDELLRQDIGQIRKAGKSSAKLVKQLLAFSRKQVLQPQVFDLKTVVADTEKMLQRMISEDILFQCSMQEDLGRVIADPMLIEQVIMNLCVNARDAMPMGGQLTIETANIDLDEVYANQHLEVDAGPYVMLAVSDTGIGLDEETMSHIFEPFFTTKDKSKGTGLGLATVYGIIKQSNGHIAVYSEVGYGTTFKVYLPRVRDNSDLHDSDPVTMEMGKGGSETIMLVEDEELVIELAKNILEECGYTVLSASNGKQALKILEEHSSIPALLVTDVVMPGMGGRELADRVRARWPQIPTIYISGYSDEAIVRHGVLDSNSEFLQKPFSPEALAKKVRRVLDKAQ